MERSYDNHGFLDRARSSFGYGRSVALTKWGGQLWVHIGDNSKCWDNRKFDKTKSKTISMKWCDAITLREKLNEFEAVVRQIEAEQVLA